MDASALPKNQQRPSKLDSISILQEPFSINRPAVHNAFTPLTVQEMIEAMMICREDTSIGVIVLRIRRPDMQRPFRMWLYPLPALIAAASFVFILVSRTGFSREIRYAAVILIGGIIVYLLRSWRRHEWPFAKATIVAHR